QVRVGRILLRGGGRRHVRARADNEIDQEEGGDGAENQASFHKANWLVNNTGSEARLQGVGGTSNIEHPGSRGEAPKEGLRGGDDRVLVQFVSHPFGTHALFLRQPTLERVGCFRFSLREINPRKIRMKNIRRLWEERLRWITSGTILRAYATRIV